MTFAGLGKKAAQEKVSLKFHFFNQLYRLSYVFLLFP